MDEEDAFAFDVSRRYEAHISQVLTLVFGCFVQDFICFQFLAFFELSGFKASCLSLVLVY